MSRWDEATVAHLKRLYADGATYPVIAKSLGADFTHNMVVSKLRRLKLDRRAAKGRPGKPFVYKRYAPAGDRYEIPAKAHRLVQELFAEINRAGVTVEWVAEKAGVSLRSIETWRWYHVMPSIAAIEACFNVLGLTLQPVRFE